MERKTVYEKNNNSQKQKVLEKTGKSSVELNSPQSSEMNSKKSLEKKKQHVKKTENSCQNFSIDCKEYKKIQEKFKNNKKLLPNGYPKIVLKKLTCKEIKDYSVNCSVESQMCEKEIIQKSSEKKKQSVPNLSEICGNKKSKKKVQKKKKHQCKICQKFLFDG